MERIAGLDGMTDVFEKTLLDAALQNRHEEAVRAATVLQALTMRQMLALLRENGHRTTALRGLTAALENVSKGIELRLRTLLPQAKGNGKQGADKDQAEAAPVQP